MIDLIHRRRKGNDGRSQSQSSSSNGTVFCTPKSVGAPCVAIGRSHDFGAVPADSQWLNTALSLCLFALGIDARSRAEVPPARTID